MLLQSDNKLPCDSNLIKIAKQLLCRVVAGYSLNNSRAQ